jgi:hypothetical protein
MILAETNTHAEKHHKHSWQNLNLEKVFVNNFVFDLFRDQGEVDSEEDRETEQPFSKFCHFFVGFVLFFLILDEISQLLSLDDSSMCQKFINKPEETESNRCRRGGASKIVQFSCN